MEFGRLMGSFHPILIHFPIVLLLSAVAIELLAFFKDEPRLRWAGRLTLLFGAVTTLFAFVCGNFAELWAARSGISQEALEYHEFLATVTSWAFVGLTGWRLLMREGENPTPKVWRALWLAVAIAASIGLIYTGYHGGELVYKHGAAVQNVGLQRVPTHEDLFQLTQRQDQDSIFYSDMMHHIFGWMVLILSVLLFLDQFAPKIAVHARKIGPVLLFAGGLFLLIFSDQDAWPLYHIKPFRPITDKEVLLHKTYAVLMLAIGLRGIWSMFRSRKATVGVEKAAPTANDGWKIQNRLMAVFALVGGALLFTHIHSAAPYANIACGVYIHHTTMGLIALCIGGVKLLDDTRRKSSLVTRMAYPALMCIEAVLLINYNEGLPWFMGYGGYSSQAAHGGLVAPLGPHRAEMVYNPDTNRLEIFVQKPDSGTPVPLPVNTATAVVRLGEEATEVPLRANPGGETVSAHYAENIPFLRGAAIFTVQAKLAIDGKEYTADFEPWIDPAQAIHSQAAWVCPMHPNIGSDKPGRCTISTCGMALEPRLKRRPSGELHDADFKMQLASVPSNIEAGKTANLQLNLIQGSSTVRDLEVVHTKKLHLIIANSDLSFFDHVHPEEQSNGIYSLDYTFPVGGDYSLYADLTPTGASNQVFRLPVKVSGKVPGTQQLRESVAPAKQFGSYRIALAPSPFPLKANDECNLTFTIEENGVPVSNLEPYLGAGGHCVILSQDSRDYLHSHPLELPGYPTSGPQVTFHTNFPHPGLYKVWGQFQHRGKVLIADFVLRVP